MPDSGDEPSSSYPLCPDGVDRLPQDKDDILESFLAHLETNGILPYPAQEEAILELFDDRNVILNTPTGSGKSLVAAAMHYKSLCQGRRSYYTCPIKALVNEKFLSLCRDFGPQQVGLVTGDATVNPGAPIICCTAEILANVALARGDQAEVDDVIMDEFHYYSDRDRGVAWQVPMLTLPQARFLLMSATLGDTSFFSEDLERLTGASTALVQSVDRPVPLEYQWIEESIEHTVEDLCEKGQAPIYVVHFTQRSVAESAKKFLSLNFCSKEEKKEIQSIIADAPFRSPYGKEIKKLLAHGVGIHHAGLLPRYRLLVESLSQKGLLKVICGTDTLGVGINVPIRTVLFTQLCKYDGKSTRILPVRDFHQIAGRAGRKGFDDRGLVIALPPPHVIENLKMERKAAADPKKKKKFVRKKAPERGFVPWDEKTFRKLISSDPEKLTSSFEISHGMLMHVLGRSREGEDGVAAMRQLIRDCHESDVNKRRHQRRAFQLFRSLVDQKIVDLPTAEEAKKTGQRIRFNVDLQDDFSLNQSLALWAVDTLPQLDPESPEYHLDVLTLCESVLEDPGAILMKQRDKAKGELIAKLKDEGVEYEERIARLEEVEYPKPLREFVYETFNQFAVDHPWVGQDDNIRPKSIAREMVECFLPFADYIRRYELQRSEGLLLRHLSQTYKMLTQTVPDSDKTEEIYEVEVFLESQIRSTDSSLLDEWQAIETAAANPDAPTETLASPPEAPVYDLTKDAKAFPIQVRNAAFLITRNIVEGWFEEASESLGDHPDPRGLETLLNDFYEQYPDGVDLGPEARRSVNFEISDGKVRQSLISYEATEWSITYRIDMEATREQQLVVLELEEVATIL